MRYAYLRNVIPIASDDSRHEIMVPTEVLRGAVIYDVRTVFERALEVRAHHGVVHNDDRVRALLLNHGADPRNVNNLQQRVCRRLKQHHGDLGREVGYERGWVGGVDMVYLDAHVCAKVGEETMCATIDVVTSDELVAWLENARDDVQACHARRDRESMLGGGYLRDVMLCRCTVSDIAIKYTLPRDAATRLKQGIRYSPK